MPVGDILPEITLILTAAAILLVAAFVRQDWHRLAAPLALLGLAVAGVLLVAQLGRSALTFSRVRALAHASPWTRLLTLRSPAFAVVLPLARSPLDHRHGQYTTIPIFSALGAVGR